MTKGFVGVPLASARTEIFEFVVRLMPAWVQLTVLALVVLCLVGSWIVKLVRKIRYRRAVRAGAPVHAAARYGQGRGADHLGAYAPQRDRLPPAPAPAGPSGADFLGAYAPGQGQGQDAAR
ncbi:hypothetical protein [Streptomyces sp. NPDC002580]|uniref:hypothetical protein n=1 Tax=Streptomyces sp. NPDC002580 TaxID=3364653 RepID=UPI00367443EE